MICLPRSLRHGSTSQRISRGKSLETLTQDVCMHTYTLSDTQAYVTANWIYKWYVSFLCAALKYCTLPQRSERGQRDQDDPGEEGTSWDETVKRDPWMHSYSHSHINTWTHNQIDCSPQALLSWVMLYLMLYFFTLWKIWAATRGLLPRCSILYVILAWRNRGIFNVTLSNIQQLVSGDSDACTC